MPKVIASACARPSRRDGRAAGRRLIATKKVGPAPAAAGARSTGEAFGFIPPAVRDRQRPAAASTLVVPPRLDDEPPGGGADPAADHRAAGPGPRSAEKRRPGPGRPPARCSPSYSLVGPELPTIAEGDRGGTPW